MIQNRQYRIIPTFKMIVEKRFPFGIVISPGAHLNFLKVDRPKYDACNDKTEKEAACKNKSKETEPDAA